MKLFFMLLISSIPIYSLGQSTFNDSDLRNIDSTPLIMFKSRDAIYINNQREKFFFSDVKQRMDSLILKYYNDSSGNYVNSRLYKYLYNTNQLLAGEFTCLWNGISWNDYDKYEYFYNDQFLIDSIVEYHMTQGSWTPIYKNMYSYYEDGTIQLKLRLYKESGIWQEKYKSEYYYLSDTVIENQYNLFNNNWEIQYNITTIYVEGFKTSQIYMASDQIGGLVKYSRLDFEYENDNLIRQITRFTDDWGQWQEDPYFGEEFFYDSFNNLERYEYSYYSPQTSEWELQVESYNSYDNQYDYDDLIIPCTVNELYYRHMLFSTYENSYVDPEYKIMYQPFFNPVTIQKASSLEQWVTKIFPNPAVDHLNISWSYPVKEADLSVYNSTGQLELQLQVNNQTNFPVSSLVAGLHFFVITSGVKLIGTGKFTKE